jgi:lysozyme family protein
MAIPAQTTPALDFDDCFERLIGSEGGFSNDPKDPGNWTGGRPGVGILKGTKFGLSARTYPDLDIEHLTVEQAKAVYRRDWWDRLDAPSLPPAFVYQMWDFAVNAGWGNAVRCMQRAAAAADDGHIGAITLAAVKALAAHDLIDRFTAQKIRHYVSLTLFASQGRGWMNRTADLLEYAAIDTVD